MGLMRMGFTAAMIFMAPLLVWGLEIFDKPALIHNIISVKQAVDQKMTFDIHLELTIAEKYHINSDRPADPGLIPTSLAVASSTPAELSSLKFTPSSIEHQPNSASPNMVWGGKVQINARLTLPPAEADQTDAKSILPTRTVLLVLIYQACDDQACLMPEVLEIEIPLARAAHS